ncbi:MAG: NfeD family protein [Coriobacteriia bacterium]|nr:NfeD family protein [Coriobacteriia bacterium]MBS5477210.1 NfeD family protein [Coriobacteriia bacterium]
MGSFLPFVWLGVAVVAGLVEAASPLLICIWFCLGAAVTFVVSLFVDNVLTQVIVFLVASFVMLLALRPFMRKRVNAKGEPQMNADGYVGRVVTVTQGITATHDGRALLGDTSWLARCANGGELSSGSQARVVSVDGARLVVEPLGGGAA